MAYLRHPTIHGDDVVFVSDDDLWCVDAGGGRAHRLTTGVGESSGPRLTPDGQQIAFVGREEGAPDIYVMPAAGGSARRLTFQGGLMQIAGFDPTGLLIYATDADQAFYRDRRLHRISLTGGPAQLLAWGPASVIEYGPGPAVVLGRIVDDPARWKRYRGGRVGDLWIDADGSGEFGRLVRLDGNLADPCVVGDRIYFIADHEGIGNVYSCTVEGADVRRHTHHEDFYARGLTADSHRLVYSAGASLWLLDPADGAARPIEVRAATSASQRQRQFVPADRNLDTVTLAPDGARIALCARGKAFTMGHFAGPVRQIGEPDGVRYRLLRYLHDGIRLVAAASDETDREWLVLFDSSAATALSRIDTGRAVELTTSPVADLVAVTNHRNELMLLDLRQAEPTGVVVDSSRYGRIADLAWSPDGDWLAYACPEGSTTTAIKLLRVADRTLFHATRPVLRDGSPAFDPLGRYLYFIGWRTFDPVVDQMQFDLGFPLGARPYAITLRAEQSPPFLGEIAPPGKPATSSKKDTPGPAEEARSAEEAGPAEEARPAVVEIDLDGIERRVVAFDVPDGRYERIAATADKVLFTSYPIVGARDIDTFDVEQANRSLHVCTLATGKCEQIADGLTDFWLGPDHSTVLYRSRDRLRAIAAGDKPNDETQPGAGSGWIDLDRVKVSVRPDAEWRQMFREAWRLQREHFWNEEMSSVDWAAVYDRYLPLVDRVATRSELSDLLWELHGELGTSHAYESGGAYRYTPTYDQGYLGVDWDVAGDGRYRIGRILVGDVWSATEGSPLARPGLNISPGDEVVAINGVAVNPQRPPGALLVSQAEHEIEVTVRRGEGPARPVRVRALADEQPLRYRDWVQTARAYAHDRSGGRVGYLHIPDMVARGFGEFHRGLLTEFDREALIVDVRFNRGGNVSGLLLQKLARRRLGYGFSRWEEPTPYPDQSPRGVLIMLTNEFAGSDGDIVSHAFKQLRLGPLIGRRTWGGVVGIWPRHRLADGTVTTQPEYAFAFDNVGWGVENYGTDPDIEVDNRPQDYAAGVDAQLERAVQEALATLTRTPAHTPVRPRLG